MRESESEIESERECGRESGRERVKERESILKIHSFFLENNFFFKKECI